MNKEHLGAGNLLGVSPRQSQFPSPQRSRSKRELAFEWLAFPACFSIFIAFFWIPTSLIAQQQALSTLPSALNEALGLPPNQPQTKQSKKSNKTNQSSQFPQPALTIPVGPIGFAPPAPFYLGSRMALVSLDFLDENNLLFTFRVPGLISREHTAASELPGEEPSTDEKHNERHIRAVVLSLPTGKVTAEALWRLHDASPYISILKNDKFLLRDRNTVRLGDASLHLDLFLRFPGPVSFLELGPDQSLLVTNTTEVPARSASDAPTSSSSASQANAAAQSSSTVSSNGLKDDRSSMSSAENQDLVRVLRMDNRSVMLFSRVNGVRHIPLDGEGFYEALREKGSSWSIHYQDFRGSSIPLASVESLCSPTLDVVSAGIVLASGCAVNGGRELAAVSLDRRRLWQLTLPPTKVWPALALSQNGLRVAREALDATHPVGPNYPLDASDIRDQSVQVYDLATGNVVLSVFTSPILDGGGNFALSPSGRQLAVLNSGAIQIFNLPPAPPMAPVSTAGKP